MTTINFHSDKYTFDMEILKVGREHCDPKKLMESSMRYYYSLHYVLYGSGSLIVGGKEVKLVKGDAFLVYRGEDISYFPDPEDPWSYLWIDFNGQDLIGFLDDCGFTEEKPYIRIKDHANFVSTAVQPLIDGLDGGPAQALMTAGNVFRFFAMLIRNDHKNHLRGRKLTVQQRLKEFRDVLTFVNNNYRMNFPVQRVCEETFLSEFQLNSMFREFTGLTYVNYVNRYRISEAAEILLHEDIGIKEAAHRVGIEDVAYFSRLFVKWKGVSPRDYRREYPNDNPFSWLKGKAFDVR